MAALGNSPSRDLVIRLEARKSFSLGVWITDSNGKALSLVGTTLRFVVKKNPERAPQEDDSDNLIVNSVAVLDDAQVGFARFNLQASDLHHKPGEYEFAMVLWDEGYSTVVARGVIDIVSNTEFLSVEDTYTDEPGMIASALRITLRNRDVLQVRTGSTLAPGDNTFTDALLEKLDGIEYGAGANPPPHNRIPEGGLQGTHLIREADGFVGWAYPHSVDGGFVHTGVIPDEGDPGFFVPGGSVVTEGSSTFGAPQGHVPTSNGIGYWTWEPAGGVQPGEYVESINGAQGVVSLSLGDIPDTVSRVAVSPAQRDAIGPAAQTAEWAQISDVPTDLLKAGVVTAADVSSGTLENARVPRVSELRGFTSGTAAPSNATGSDGDLYFQYE